MARPYRDAEFGRRLGARLQLLIDESGGTQLEFAFASQIAPSQISRWCRGASTPSAEYLTAICAYFKVSADWLLGLTLDRETVPTRIVTDVDAMADELEDTSPPRPGRSNGRRS